MKITSANLIFTVLLVFLLSASLFPSLGDVYTFYIIPSHIKFFYLFTYDEIIALIALFLIMFGNPNGFKRFINTSPIIPVLFVSYFIILFVLSLFYQNYDLALRNRWIIVNISALILPLFLQISVLDIFRYIKNLHLIVIVLSLSKFIVRILHSGDLYGLFGGDFAFLSVVFTFVYIIIFPNNKKLFFVGIISSLLAVISAGQMSAMLAWILSFLYIYFAFFLKSSIILLSSFSLSLYVIYYFIEYFAINVADFMFISEKLHAYNLIWSASFQQVLDSNLIFRFGFGEFIHLNVPDSYEEFAIETSYDLVLPHNIFVSFFFLGGIPGLLLFIFVVMLAYLGLSKPPINVHYQALIYVIIVLLVYGLSTPLEWKIRHGFLFFLCLGVAIFDPLYKKSLP